MRPLNYSFYNRPTRIVAQELLGKIFVRNHHGKRYLGRVVETEAYLGANDPASHASKGLTKRNCVMFGKPGISYIYLCYGFHYMLNVVTEKKGIAGAVLIRGFEPVSEKYKKILNGPGKITKAFKISLKDNGLKFTPQNGMYFAEDKYQISKIKKTGRVGIKQGADLPLRYLLVKEIINKTKE